MPLSGRDTTENDLVLAARRLLARLAKESQVVPCTRVSLTCTNFEQIAANGIGSFLIKPTPKPTEPIASIQATPAVKKQLAVRVDHGPDADEVDEGVLEELPPELREEVRQQMRWASSAKRRKLSSNSSHGRNNNSSTSGIARFFTKLPP